jgi:serine/threonine protein kinase
VADVTNEPTIETAVADVTNQPTIDLDRARSALATSGPLSSSGVGQVLRDRYVLQARLGTGGQGTVFKALDRLRTMLPDTHQYVALKILHAGDCSEQTLANLRLEFHCGQVLSHRNIVNVYELDRDGDVVFFTMELLEGEPLSDVIKRLRPAKMRKSQAMLLIQQLGAGLAHAHERGVVHGDLNPRNIFITREGELRILDFGAAHRVLAVKSRSEHADYAFNCGTPAYASCEQLEGRRADARDDLYALACICYELLAGTHPFASRPATLARDYRVNLVRPPGLTGRQWRALQKGLSWHRGGRSISVRLWMHRLTKERLHEHSVTPLQELTQSTDRVKSKIPWRAAAASFLVATLITAAVQAPLRSTSAPKAIDAPSPILALAENRDVNSVPPNEPAATTFDVTQTSVSPRKDLAYGAPHAKATALVISVEPSIVRSDDHFAEIRLHRNLLQKSSSFTWWTEPATAKPQVDYVPEAVAIQTFPGGYRSTRLYVRLLPQSLRSQRSYFYIAIAQAGVHEAPATVIRRQVWLPPISNLQARR